MSIAEKFEVIADEVYEKGKKAEYDKFWDSFQDYGKRTDYGTYAFLGSKWNDENFYPKYDFIITGNCLGFFNSINVTNIKQRLIDCGVKLDTSNATNLTSIFNQSKTTVVPEFDVRKAPKSTHLFYFAVNIISIDKIILNENNIIDSWFANCTKLENLTIEGTIGQNGFNVQWSKKLTKTSLLSILKALSLNITETKTITFSTEHQSIIETDTDCKPYWEAAKNAGWSFVYA